MDFSFSRFCKSWRWLICGTVLLTFSRSVAPGRAPELPPIAAQGPNEQLWIVESIVRDGVRMAAYASGGASELWREEAVSVRLAAESSDGFQYLVNIGQTAPMTVRLAIKGSVWEPKAYVPCFRRVVRALRLHAAAKKPMPGRPVLVSLTHPRVEMLQEENARISQWLTHAPLEPAAHEEAALLLATFGLRENAGSFRDPRGTCNRLTAHLAFAAALRGRTEVSRPGRVAHLLGGLLAETALSTEQEIKSLSAEVGAHPELKPWLLAAKLRARQDWRLAAGQAPSTLLEKLELFRATCMAEGGTSACAALMRSHFEDLADWPRILLEYAPGAPEVRRFASFALPFEEEETMRIFPALAGVPAQAEEYARTLNGTPGGAISGADFAGASVHVIDDGRWGQFLQRHFCHAIQQVERHLREGRGRPDIATAFRQTVFTIYGKLQLMPLAMAMVPDAEAQQNGAPALAALFRDFPERVPDGVWLHGQDLEVQAGSEEWPNAEEWFSPALPTGTAFGLAARWHRLPALQRLGAEELAKLARLAPWDYGIAERLVVARLGRRPTAREFQTELGRFAHFQQTAWRRYAEVVRDTPAEFVAGLRQMTEAEPRLLPVLGRYYVQHQQAAEAAAVYLKGLAQPEADPVIAEHAAWLADFYLDQGQTEDALAIGKKLEANGTAAGAQAMAHILERLGRNVEAETLYEKVEDVFEDPSPLALFYERQAAQAPEYAAKLQAAVGRVFPKGIIPAPGETGSKPPIRGVAVRRDATGMQATGLCANDVVVAVNGQQTGTLAQYAYLRGARMAEALELLVYRQGEYREVRLSSTEVPPLSDFATYHR